MIPMFFSSFKCCEMVACAKPNSSTKSLQIQAFWLMIYWRMATRAGCPKTLNKEANLFCSSVNISDFVSPIVLNLISQYYDNIFEHQNEFHPLPLFIIYRILAIQIAFLQVSFQEQSYPLQASTVGLYRSPLLRTRGISLIFSLVRTIIRKRKALL